MMAIAQFYTDTQIPVPSVTADQMQEIDRIAVEETGPALLQMMENAGRNLALVALAHLGTNWRNLQIVVLAGKGGNGGGGICVARHLANRGLSVQLCLSAPDRLQEVSAYQHHVYTATTGAEITPDDLASKAPDLVIDALLGYSLTSSPRGIVADLIDWANQSRAPIVSLDLPSGLNATTGENLSACQNQLKL
jgi:NAD(P)H-hydrate epimerase